MAKACRPGHHHWHKVATAARTIRYTCCECGLGRRRWRPGFKPKARPW